MIFNTTVNAIENNIGTKTSQHGLQINGTNTQVQKEIKETREIKEIKLN
jgi:hypothetical protein